MLRTCKSCQSDKIRVCQRDGDIVCTTCGLVQEGYLCDETLYGNTPFEDRATCSFSAELLPDDKQKKNVQRLFRQASLCILGDEFENIVADAYSLYETVAKRHRGEQKKALYCVCFILACKSNKSGTDPKHVYDYFGVPMWLHYSKLNLEIQTNQTSKKNATRLNDAETSIKRMVYDWLNIDNNYKWKIFKVACQLQHQVECLTSKVRMSKLNACIIYISCKVNNVENMSIERIAELYNVTKSTLRKHELLIQSVLENGAS